MTRQADQSAKEVGLSRSISGRVAVLTGAASGIGRATANLFAAEGATVAMLDRADPEPVVQEILVRGGTAAGWIVDLSDRNELGSVVEDIAARLGGIDILVNNAGIAESAALSDPNWEQIWERSLAVNLTAYARMIRACLPYLQASPGGRIVNIASTEGLVATPANSAYTVAKHGVIGLTRSLAVEFARAGITVNCVCPGPIHTGLTSSVPDEDKNTFARRRVPLRRYGIPEEVANMTLSLCLPAASYTTGAVLPVDGGLLVKAT